MFPQSQICWWILILEIIFGGSRAPCDWSHIADLSDVSCVEPLRTLPGPFINPTHLHPPPYTYVLLKIHIVLLFAHHGLFLLYHFKCTEKKHLLMRFCDDLRGREAVKAANSASTYCSTTQPIEEGKAHNMTLIDCNYIEVSAPNNNVARVNPPTWGPQPTWRVTWLVSTWQNWELWPTAKSSWLPVTLFFTQSLFSCLFHLFSVF